MEHFEQPFINNAERHCIRFVLENVTYSTKREVIVDIVVPKARVLMKTIILQSVTITTV